MKYIKDGKTAKIIVNPPSREQVYIQEQERAKNAGQTPTPVFRYPRFAKKDTKENTA